MRAHHKRQNTGVGRGCAHGNRSASIMRSFPSCLLQTMQAVQSAMPCTAKVRTSYSAGVTIWDSAF